MKLIKAPSPLHDMGATKIWHESFSPDLGINIILDHIHEGKESISSCFCTTGIDYKLHPPSLYSILRLTLKIQTLPSGEENVSQNAGLAMPHSEASA